MNELSAAAQYTLEMLRERLAAKRIVVLTGAGISTDSGIPDYRGAGRTPKHPMTFDSFMGSFAAQQRYWARSYVGWSRIALAKPNNGHFALAQAETSGQVIGIITQNVDGLHQEAGSKNVIDLHGRLDRVKCVSCNTIHSRASVEDQMQLLNPSVNRDFNVEFTPDGDAEIEATASFKIPVCTRCKGTLKPDVVFFGEAVPADRVERAFQLLDAHDALLVAGSSLTVNSGLRFVRRAAKAGKPVAIVNLGPTKGDDLAMAKIEANTSIALERLLLD